MKNYYKKIQNGEPVILFGTYYKKVGNLIQTAPHFSRFQNTYRDFTYQVSLDLFPTLAHNGIILHQVFDKDVEILHVERFIENVTKTRKSLDKNGAPVKKHSENYYLVIETNKGNHQVEAKSKQALYDLTEYIENYMWVLKNEGVLKND